MWGGGLRKRPRDGRSSGHRRVEFGTRRSRRGMPLSREAVSGLVSKLRSAAYTAHGVDLEKLFRRIDRDRSGTVEFEEFRNAVRKEARVSVEDVSDEDLLDLFEAADGDGNGALDVEEFVEFLSKDSSGSVGRTSVGGTSRGTPASVASSGRRAWGVRRSRRGMPLSREAVSGLVSKLRSAAYTAHGMDLEKLFRRIDRDRSGTVEFEEFRNAVRKEARVSVEDVSDEDLLDLFEAADGDGNGALDVEEFVEFLGKDSSGSRVATQTPPTRGRRQSQRASNPPTLDEARSRFRAAAILAGVDVLTGALVDRAGPSGLLDIVGLSHVVRVKGGMSSKQLSASVLDVLLANAASNTGSRHSADVSVLVNWAQGRDVATGGHVHDAAATTGQVPAARATPPVVPQVVSEQPLPHTTQPLSPFVVSPTQLDPTFHASQEVEYVLEITSLVVPGSGPVPHPKSLTQGVEFGATPLHDTPNAFAAFSPTTQSSTRPSPDGSGHGGTKARHRRRSRMSTAERLQRWEEARKVRIEQQRLASSQDGENFAECTFRPKLVRLYPPVLLVECFNRALGLPC